MENIETVRGIFDLNTGPCLRHSSTHIQTYLTKVCADVTFSSQVH